MFFNTVIKEDFPEKTKLNFNYKKPNIQIKPIALNSNMSTRRELISVAYYYYIFFLDYYLSDNFRFFLT